MSAPCPKGPVVTSIPWDTLRSGCPGVLFRVPHSVCGAGGGVGGSAWLVRVELQMIRKLGQFAHTHGLTKQDPILTWSPTCGTSSNHPW